MGWVKSLFVKDKSFYKLVLTMAIPVVMQNMITIGLNIIDTMMLGNYGEIQIAGSSLANEVINIFAKPIETGAKQNYANLKSQCAFLLQEKVQK